MEYVQAKTIVNRAKQPGSWFGEFYNMNIYRGCCHGCIYCDSRSECYHVENFDTVTAKKDALKIINAELARKTPDVIGTGAMSDPYNPFEKELLLTRHALELASAHGFGIAIATKSPLITRDIDVLSEIKKQMPVLAKVTITTADDGLCKLIEPNVEPSSKRFEAVKALSGSGIFTGILLMPVLPFLEDNEQNILQIVDAAHKSGARFIYPAFGVTLRQNQRDYYFEKLDKHFPGMKQEYIKRYGLNYSCTSPHSRKLWGAFKAECDRRGLLYSMGDIISAYKMGYKNPQLSFFD